MERHFTETRKFFQLPQAFKEEILVDSNSRCAPRGGARTKTNTRAAGHKCTRHL